MNLQRIGLCCPRCREKLREDGLARPELVCSGCSAVFPILAGIPDLRVFADPYIDIASDRAKGLKLAERLADYDFAGLIDFYYSITEVVPAAHASNYKNALLSAEARSQAALASWEAAADAAERGALLDLGCGTAPLLIAAARRGYRGLAGIDIAFRWLVVARKRLEEAGLDIPLVCACAEALPFQDRFFQCVAAESVIETVDDQARALAEASRVLVPGGRLFLATPNRLSLGPDPHAGIWGGGYWPKSLLAARVRRQGGIPPKRRLLTVFSLRRLLSAAGFGRLRVFLPRIPDEVRARRSWLIKLVVDAYGLARRLPVSRHLLFVIGPLLYAVGQKAGSRQPPNVHNEIHATSSSTT